MTVDECVRWVEGRIASFKPTDDLGQVTTRLPMVMGALVSLEGGSVFGFTLPPEIRADVVSAARPLLQQAVDGWRAHLERRFGDEGLVFFDRAALECGLKKPAKRELRHDEAVARAVDRLRARLADSGSASQTWFGQGWLEEGDAHGYALAPPDSDAAEQLARHERRSPALPKLLEALYAELGGLWTGPVEPPGGEQPFERGAASYVIMPLSEVLDHADDRPDGLVVFGQQGDYFSLKLLGSDDGAVYSISRLDYGPPRKVADSLVEWLDALAAAYGWSG